MRRRVLIRLLGFLWRYRGRFALACFCLLAASGFGLAVPWLIKEVIDFGLRAGNPGYLVLSGGLVILFSVARGAFAYGQGYLSEAVSQRAAYDLRNALFDKFQRLSFAFHDRAQTGQLMSRATADVEGVRIYLNIGIMRLLTVAVMVPAVLVLAVQANFRLALILLVSVVAIGLWAMNISSRLRPIWLRVQQAMGDLGTVLQENLTGIRVVQAFCQEEAQQQLYDRHNRRLRELTLRASRVGALHQPFLLFMLNLAVVATLWVGGREVMAGRLTLGELVAFTQYLLMLFMPVRALGWVMNIFARAHSAGERIFEILDSVQEVPEKPDAVELKEVRGEVVFENVTFAYSDRAPALRNVNLRVRPGEVVALVGPTGSGKSTLVQLIPRFYDVTSGRVLIDGHDVRDLKLASLRRNIGIVLQDTFLFAATIRENIAYGWPDATDEEVIAAAKAARIHDFIMSLPDGYNTWVGERGLTLSGGQRQRIAIARVLLLNPKILILDDALSSVDVETEAEIQAALETVMRGRTTFIVAHRLKTVRLAHRIVVMVGGEVVEEGTHEELMARNGFYRQVYETQLRAQEDAGLLVRGDD